MVNPPQNPNGSPNRDRILDFDELLAIVLALLGLGTVLWWGIGRGTITNPLTNGLARQGGQTGVAQAGLSGDVAGADVSAAGLSGVTFSDNLGAGDLGDGAGGSVHRGADILAQGKTRRSADSVPTAQRDMVAMTLPGASTRASTTRVSTPDPLASSGAAPALGDRPALSADAENLPEPAPATLPEPAIDAPDVPSTDAVPPPLDISDVPEDHWAYPFIRGMYEEGYLPDFPDGQFQPDKPLTRAELAALISRAFGDSPQTRASATFVDVPEGYWAAEAINTAVATEFMSGYPEDRFEPDQLIPRYQVMVALVSGLKTTLAQDPAPILDRFGDLATMPEWANTKVATAAQSGMVVNYPNLDSLRPIEPATRAEIVAMMYQALVQQGKLGAVESEFVVQPN